MSDIIIVGAGMAGLMCANRCVSEGVSVTVVHHGLVRDSSSFYAQGGMACVRCSSDSMAMHVQDTVCAGDGLCIQSVVEQMVTSGPDVLTELTKVGVSFEKDATGEYSLAREGAHSRARIVHVKDYTGQAIVQALLHQLSNHPLVHWVQAPLRGILRSSNGVVGILAGTTKRLAQQVVLATGGYSGLFHASTNPSGNRGAPIALAYRAGAILMDLELIQFHPTVYCKDGFPPLLLSEALRGEGAFLENRNHDRFMERYHALADLAPRDVVSRAIILESEPSLNIVPLRDTLQNRFPTIFRELMRRGWHSDQACIPVHPLAHYTIGGIATDIHGKTNVRGLSAIGECACTGVHGANRLASNSLLESGVMGLHCANRLLSGCETASGRAEPVINDDTTVDQGVVDCITRCMGVSRCSDQLTTGIHQLTGLQSSPMTDFALAILHSALARTHNCGVHYRTDATPAPNHLQHATIQYKQPVLHGMMA